MTDEPEWWDHIEGQQRSLVPVEQPPVVITPVVPTLPVVSPDGAWVWNGASWQPNPWYQAPLLVVTVWTRVTVRPGPSLGGIVGAALFGPLILLVLPMELLTLLYHQPRGGWALAMIGSGAVGVLAAIAGLKRLGSPRDVARPAEIRALLQTAFVILLIFMPVFVMLGVSAVLGRGR